MYLGHALLAFALAAPVARWAGLERRRALLVGVVAGVYGMVPDIDMWHTVYVIARAGPTNVFPTTEYVWPESWIVHRTLTHSLLTGGLAVLVVFGFSDAYRRRTTTPLWSAALPAIGSMLLIGLLVAVALSTDELLGLVTMGLFLGASLAVAWWALRRGLTPLEVSGAAAVGILSHPFGDVWMGHPPAFLYPLSSEPPIDRLYFSAEPTYNLLVAFGIEVTLGIVAALVAVRLTGRTVRETMHPVALAGFGYAGAVSFVPPPTFQLAYGFAAGVVAVGSILGAVATVHRVPNLHARPRDAIAVWGVTALVAACCCLLGYAAAYSVMSPA
ncbi:metal-dependent hydrolase [Natronobeatus ordinarius]|uniref:metal-dependent hydrolase n=1 Tax=Natronobeatus ordinarius TaxID=2963433 RepID=UPI0020CFBFC0|nr:metal-dependent hydrolase [Natronobeatus ordinarius]